MNNDHAHENSSNEEVKITIQARMKRITDIIAESQKTLWEAGVRLELDEEGNVQSYKLSKPLSK